LKEDSSPGIAFCARRADSPLPHRGRALALFGGAPGHRVDSSHGFAVLNWPRSRFWIDPTCNRQTEYLDSGICIAALYADHIGAAAARLAERIRHRASSVQLPNSVLLR
jgi:hypothetical protein